MADNSVVLERMLSKQPMSSVCHYYGGWAITRHTKPALVKLAFVAVR